ncbi:hypothetical protein XELAEV_18041270mg [Xenopus laevis]|uniref:Uncharacterized protein n=1 Tax=Xenopus laevis TaxID=8355 RepID=A0A974H4Y4_XENLA|nr:hypothetical protein XELAEV_18041270mg [Xenopus laevis]
MRIGYNRQHKSDDQLGSMVERIWVPYHSPECNDPLLQFTNEAEMTSDKSLTTKEISVLNKGLKFAPCSGPSKFETYIDLHKCIRQLTLKRHFALRSNGEAIDN